MAVAALPDALALSGVEDSAVEDSGRVVPVPAGNGDLERCHGLCEPGDGAQALAWRVHPDDETSNVLGIRALPEYRPGGDGGAPDVPLPLEIDLDRPGRVESRIRRAGHGAARELAGGLGRGADLPRAKARAQRRAGSGWSSPRVAFAKAGWGRAPVVPPCPVKRIQARGPVRRPRRCRAHAPSRRNHAAITGPV